MQNDKKVRKWVILAKCSKGKTALQNMGTKIYKKLNFV